MSGIKSCLFVSLIVVFSGAIAQEAVNGQVTAPASDSLPDSKVTNISKSESMLNTLSSYLKKENIKKGFTTLPDGQSRLIITATGAIVVGPKSSDFVKMRSLAFNNAYLDAQKQCVAFQSNVISNEISKNYTKGSQSISIDKSQSTVDAENSLKASMNAELSKSGVQTEKVASEEEIKKVLSTTTIKTKAAAIAAGQCSGLKVVAVFEQNPSNGQGAIGIVASYTSRGHEIVDAMLTGNYSAISKGEIGRPVDEYLPENSQDRITLFGTHMVRDENGEYVLMSFGQAQPISEFQTDVDAAVDEARLEADSSLRNFLGSAVYAQQTMSTDAQTLVRSGVSESVIDSKFENEKKSIAKALPIEGSYSVDEWQTSHPATNTQIVGVVSVWKPSAAAFSSLIRTSNNKTEGLSNERAVNGLPSSQPGASQPVSSNPGARTSNPYSGSGSLKGREF